eukprot:6190085-Pleurochrysis_carterae.AAC.3
MATIRRHKYAAPTVWGFKIGLSFVGRGSAASAWSAASRLLERKSSRNGAANVSKIVITLSIRSFEFVRTCLVDGRQSVSQ